MPFFVGVDHEVGPNVLFRHELGRLLPAFEKTQVYFTRVWPAR